MINRIHDNYIVKTISPVIKDLKEHVYLYPAAGSSNSAIKLSLNELEKYSNYTGWVEISKKISS